MRGETLYNELRSIEQDCINRSAPVGSILSMRECSDRACHECPIQDAFEKTYNQWWGTEVRPNTKNPWDDYND